MKKDSQQAGKSTSNRSPSAPVNYDGMITAELALLIGTLDSNAKKALVYFLRQMILARETKYGSVMMRFKGLSIFVETNTKNLFKDKQS